jgi:hypothetical protein
MRFKSTTILYFDETGCVTSAVRWRNGEVVADQIWRPLTEFQRNKLQGAYSGSSSVSDYAPKVGDLSKYSECRLAYNGDEYSCSVWEVR